MEKRFEITQLPQDETIIHAKLLVADWNAYHELMDGVFAIVRQSDQRFDLIVQVPPDPPPGLPLTHFRATARVWLKHPNLMSMILVELGSGSRSFMEKIGQIVMRMFLPKIMSNVIHLSTIDEAMNKIKALRAAETARTAAS